MSYKCEYCESKATMLSKTKYDKNWHKMCKEHFLRFGISRIPKVLYHDEGTKICKDCKQEKSNEEFYVCKDPGHPYKKLYRAGRCKTCTIKKVRERQKCRQQKSKDVSSVVS